MSSPSESSFSHAQRAELHAALDRLLGVWGPGSEYYARLDRYWARDHAPPAGDDVAPAGREP